MSTTLKGVIRALSSLLIAIIAVSGTVILGVDSETYTVNNKVNQFEEKMVRTDLDIYIVDIPEANTYKLTKTIGQFFTVNSASAHRSGCHRWHSCPSDSGSYTCGDAGYPCVYPSPSTGNTASISSAPGWMSYLSASDGISVAGIARTLGMLGLTVFGIFVWVISKDKV